MTIIDDKTEYGNYANYDEAVYEGNFTDHGPKWDERVDNELWRLDKLKWTPEAEGCRSEKDKQSATERRVQRILKEQPWLSDEQARDLEVYRWAELRIAVKVGVYRGRASTYSKYFGVENEDDAISLAHELVAELLSEYRPGSASRHTWVRNKLMGRLKNQRRDTSCIKRCPQYEVGWDDEQSGHHVESADEYDGLMERLLLEGVVGAAGLTDRQTEVFMFTVNGWKISEIAKDTGLGRDAVKQHLAAARKKIKAAMGETR